MKKQPTNELTRDKSEEKFCDDLVDLFVPYLQVLLLFIGKSKFKLMIQRVLGINNDSYDRQPAVPKETMEKTEEDDQ